jgi:hypothetical protein
MMWLSPSSLKLGLIGDISIIWEVKLACLNEPGMTELGILAVRIPRFKAWIIAASKLLANLRSIPPRLLSLE